MFESFSLYTFPAQIDSLSQRSWVHISLYPTMHTQYFGADLFVLMLVGNARFVHRHDQTVPICQLFELCCPFDKRQQKITYMQLCQEIEKATLQLRDFVRIMHDRTILAVPYHVSHPSVHYKHLRISKYRLPMNYTTTNDDNNYNDNYHYRWNNNSK